MHIDIQYEPDKMAAALVSTPSLVTDEIWVGNKYNAMVSEVLHALLVSGKLLLSGKQYCVLVS